MKKIYLVGGGVLAAALLFWMFGGGENGPSRTEFITGEITRGDLSRQVSASGAVDAVTMVEISTEISGLINELYADFNSPVEAGGLLATINPQIFRSRVRQREAELKVAEAGVALRKAEISSNEATVALAERDYERVRALRQSGNVSEAALDEAATRMETSRLALTMSKAQLQNAEAGVEMRRASLEQAQIDLEKTSIRSPIDGIVIERSIEIGQTVAASFSAPKLFRIARDLEEIEIEASIDEADIGNIRAGNPVRFNVDAHPSLQFEGTVQQVRLAPTIEQNVVTYTVVITARNRNQLLLPGMTANVDIVTGERVDVLRAPNSALRFRPRGLRQAAGGSGAEGMSDRMLARYTGQLDLTDEQRKSLETALKPAIDSMRDQFRNSGFGGPDRSGIMQGFRTAVDEALQQIATPEQLRAFRTQGQGGSGSGRTGTVWVMGEDGEPAQRRVRLGITDDQFTEIVGGQLQPGELVITGSRIIREES